jgi:dihydrofolate reductase
MRLSLIAAMDRKHLIGRDNAMPWHLPADLAHFKATTLGKPILMGRKTFESLGRPLPGRLNIVLSRDNRYDAAGITVVHDLDEAFTAAGDVPELMVIGGASLYETLLARIERMYLTFIDAEFDGDAWFPAWDANEWRESRREPHPADAKNPYPYSFVQLDRVN